MDNSLTNHNRLDSDEEQNQNKGVDIERIRNAKKRRIIQLKRWAQYDKSKEKEEMNRQRKGFPFSRKGPKSVRFCQNLILLEAGNSGDADEVRRLLSDGVCADVANSDGLTALHQCAINNNIEMCRILIHYKANVNAKDKELWTPLHAAAICGHSEICQLLIKNGADLLALNTDGNMPYDICEDEITLDIIENEMAAKGITQDQINICRKLPEQHMLNDIKAMIGRLGQNDALQTFSQLDKQGANFLHIAAASGYINVTKLLLSIGLPVDSLDKDGWQAIHVASLHSHLDVIEVLVSNGANIDSQTRQGETVYELVYDGDVYDKLLLLKQEVDKLRENQQLTSSVGLVRRRSSTNPRSASIRRTSMKEKSYLSWKEARQEAEIRLSIERKNPSENIISQNPSQELSTKVNSNFDTTINSSHRSKHFVVNEPIAESEDVNGEQILKLNKIDIDIFDANKVWALPGLANKNDKPNFTHPHPYNSPTRDPNTFPYNPKPTPNNSNSIHNQSEPLPKSGDINRHRESAPKMPEPNRQRQSTGEKVPVKKPNMLPHTVHDAEDVVEVKPLSMRSNKSQSKSPTPSQRQFPAGQQPNFNTNNISNSRISANSAKSGSSHTTPINTPRSSQVSVNRKHNSRQFTKPVNKTGKSARPDSCCSVM